MVVVLFVSGCTKLGPEYKREQTVQMPKAFIKDTNTTDQELVSWWNMFHDNTLDTLIEKAYSNNFDIAQAGVRILQARTLLGLSKGFRYPQVQTLSGSAVSSLSNSKNINAIGVSFDVTWEMDFWGKYAREIESSEANLYLSVASYRDIMTTVVAEVARNYINYTVAQERIVYAKRNIAIQKRVVAMTEVQFNSGNVSELDVQQAKTQLYSTRSKLPALELSKVQAFNALRLLLGISQEDLQKILHNKDAMQEQLLIENQQKITKVNLTPLGDFNPYAKLDASLLQRRPDVQVAEFKAKSASAKIGATQALLYPSFVLFGSLGFSSNDMFGGFTSLEDSVRVSAGPGFSWNILQYGRIKNQIRFQDAVFQESMLAYNKTLLRAINDLSNALNGYVYTKKQLYENELALKATQRAFELSSKQYNDGLVSYQRLLSTVEKLTFTQDIYAQIKGLVAINEILVYKALGGGWQNQKSAPYISEKTLKSLKNRGVDWGDYLDDVKVEHE